jgi:multidrug efflux pump subunit AcrB
MDVRVRFSEAHGLALNGEDILNIPLAANGNSGIIRVGSVMEAVKTQEVSSIQRENRRRTASFSIRTNPGDPRFYRDKTMAVLENLELPPGYKIEFDPDAVRQAETLSGKLLSFVWAILFCYMIIAAAEESFVLPLIILASVPPSLAVPVLVLVLSGSPINSAVACALVAVSGMAVNASVISAGALWRGGRGEAISFYRVIKDRLPALLATTGTTIAGSLPFLFLREGNNELVRTLAIVTVFGVGVSFFCSLTLVPALIGLFGFRRRSGTGRRKTCASLPMAKTMALPTALPEYK